MGEHDNPFTLAIRLLDEYGWNPGGSAMVAHAGEPMTLSEVLAFVAGVRHHQTHPVRQRTEGRSHALYALLYGYFGDVEDWPGAHWYNVENGRTVEDIKALLRFGRDRWTEAVDRGLHPWSRSGLALTA